MTAVGTYLYGFTTTQFQPDAQLRGLANERVRTVGFRDVAAVVSRHPVQRLVPRRANLEPHHRIVRQVSSRSPLVPAAFGHISQSEEAIVRVLRDYYDDIRGEINRLANRAEMSVKLRWTVPNIFKYFVQQHSDLRELRDRVFRRPDPSFDEKLQVGSLFDAKLASERDRLRAVLLKALASVSADSISNPPRDEAMVCDCVLLIDTAHAGGFAQSIQSAAMKFDQNYTLQYSGPWPPYSFVRLQLNPRPGNS